LRSPVATVTTSRVASSKSLAAELTVNRTCSPPGSAWGQRCVTSLREVSSSVSGVSSPPAAGTRERPPVVVGAMTMVSSGSQVAPRLRETPQILTGVPPLTCIL
jgi:hypothetical protein